MLDDHTKNQVNIYTEKKVLEELWNEIYVVNRLTDTRERHNIRYRQATMTAMRIHGNLPLSTIGQIFNKNHATIINAVRNHKSDIDFDKIYRQIYFSIERLVKDALDNYNLRVIEVDSQLNDKMNYNSVVKVYRNHITELEKENLALKIEAEEATNKYNNLIKQFKIINDRNDSLNVLVKKYKNLI